MSCRGVTRRVRHPYAVVIAASLHTPTPALPLPGGGRENEKFHFSSPVMAEPCFAWTRGRKTRRTLCAAAGGGTRMFGLAARRARVMSKSRERGRRSAAKPVATQGSPAAPARGDLTVWLTL